MLDICLFGCSPCPKEIIDHIPKPHHRAGIGIVDYEASVLTNDGSFTLTPPPPYDGGQRAIGEVKMRMSFRLRMGSSTGQGLPRRPESGSALSPPHLKGVCHLGAVSCRLKFLSVVDQTNLRCGSLDQCG